MTIILPFMMLPKVCSPSCSFRDSRNHNTSIGAPNSLTFKPARSRTIELRPSQPTVIFQYIDHLGLLLHFEGRIARTVFADEIQKVPLRHERDEFAVRR